MRRLTPYPIPDRGPLDEFLFNKRGLPEYRHKTENGVIYKIKLLHPIRDYEEMCLLWSIGANFATTDPGWVKFFERKAEDNPDQRHKWLERVQKFKEKAGMWR